MDVARTAGIVQRVVSAKNCCNMLSFTEGAIDMNDIALEEHSWKDSFDVDEEVHERVSRWGLWT